MPTVTKQFTKGMRVGSETHMDFEVREMTTEDLLNAELVASAATPMNFAAALASHQLIRAGTFQGPFTLKMVRQLDPVDFHIVRDALNEVAELGEG